MRQTHFTIVCCLLSMACSSGTKPAESALFQTQKTEKHYSIYLNGKFKERVKTEFTSIDTLNGWDICNAIFGRDVNYRKFDFDTLYSNDSIIVTRREERDHGYLFAQHKRLGYFMIRLGHPKPNVHIFADSLDGMDHKSLILLRKKTIREIDDIRNDYFNPKGIQEFNYYTDSFDF